MFKHTKLRTVLCSWAMILLVMLTFPNCSKSQEVEIEEDGPVQTRPDVTVDPFKQNEALGKGVNLGNALEAPTEGEWGMVIEEEFIQLISDAGFDAVRIPVRWNAHAMQSVPYTIADSFFERVDEVIRWALERDLKVVLNIHHYNTLFEKPQAHRERFLSIWDQIAKHYHDKPNDLIFEVLNEPHGNLSPSLWNRYLARAIEVIRVSNPYRTLVIGTAPWGGIDGLKDLSIPENERNVIVTVHYYNPFQFTHQGASWAGEQADEWVGRMWTANERQKAALGKDFDTVEEWAESHNRPIYLGEFGAYSAAPQESREIWTDYVRSAAEKRDFSWSYWEFGAGFGIYNRETNEWRDGLLEALLPESPELE